MVIHLLQKRLEKTFGKVASSFLIMWCVKSAVSYAVDLPQNGVTPTDSNPAAYRTSANLNPPIDNGNNAFEHRPPGPVAPVF